MVVHVNNSLSGRCFFLASRLTIVSLDPYDIMPLSKLIKLHLMMQLTKIGNASLDYWLIADTSVAKKSSKRSLTDSELYSEANAWAGTIPAVEVINKSDSESYRPGNETEQGSYIVTI